MKRPPPGLACVLAALSVSSVCASADTIVLRDGRKFDGRLIEQTDAQVLFEVNRFGATMNMRFDRAQVASLNVPLREGPGLVYLPIEGAIGLLLDADKVVTGEAFKRTLPEAMREKPAYLILVVDSPGGSIGDMFEIVEALQALRAEHPDLITVAYVREAMSAGAVISIACDRIIMQRGASIGAAVPYQLGPDGTPQVIEEKFQSAFRSDLRSIAEAAGHEPLLLMGMCDPAMELLSIPTTDGPRIVKPDKRSPRGTTIKKPGEVLTLTADEAVQHGLAVAIVDNIDQLPGALGLDKWHRLSDTPWHDMLNRNHALRARAVEQINHKVDEAVRVRNTQALAPVVAQLKTAVAQIETHLKAARLHIEQLDEQKKKQLLEAESARKRRQISTSAHQTYISQITEQHKQAVSKTRQQIDLLTKELGKFTEELRKIDQTLQQR